jgi:hypothetical protein
LSTTALNTDHSSMTKLHTPRAQLHCSTSVDPVLPRRRASRLSDENLRDRLTSSSSSSSSLSDFAADNEKTASEFDVTDANNNKDPEVDQMTHGSDVNLNDQVRSEQDLASVSNTAELNSDGKQTYTSVKPRQRGIQNGDIQSSTTAASMSSIGNYSEPVDAMSKNCVDSQVWHLSIHLFFILIMMGFSYQFVSLKKCLKKYNVYNDKFFALYIYYLPLNKVNYAYGKCISSLS